MTDLLADRAPRQVRSDVACRGLLAGCAPGVAAREDTWTPGPRVELRDGRGLHELLYEGGDLRRPRGWCAPPTRRLVASAMAELQRSFATVKRGETIRVLDYGTGTGLAAIELLKLCRERGVDRDLRRRGAALELHLVDVPSSWFAQGHELLRACSWTRFHALTDERGRFRALPDVVEGRRMDLVMASMVFHLIPPRALARVARGLADVMSADGRLLWNAPDLGPPQRGTVLFHDPNRALRARWKQLAAGDRAPANRVQREAVAVARDGDGDGLTMYDDRADRRILPRPNTAPDVAGALAGSFAGEVTTHCHEMTGRECVDVLLVPSNQEEFLPEIADEPARAALIEDLLLAEVLPALRRSAAGTGRGHNVLWTSGEHRLRDLR